jgi:hypothetical protein
MAETVRTDGDLGESWREVVRAYCEFMDDLFPYLTPAEQIVLEVTQMGSASNVDGQDNGAPRPG